MTYKELFDSMYPGFFQDTSISGMPEERIFTELVMDLRKNKSPEVVFDCPEAISFGKFCGNIDILHEAVARVNENWVQFFSVEEQVFCALAEDRIVAFCILSDWGRHQGLHIGGPGCVGTIPEYRKKGIGLEMVRQATDTLREEGFDLSWIHYTQLEQWYGKLGYQSVLKWNCRGIISNKE
ncbi:MAG: GNAT family N-acetyltransferase [Bacillota bacterium]|nr:GNAT family N-acetyltransferase [Bacillota bacterium]